MKNAKQALKTVMLRSWNRIPATIKWVPGFVDLFVLASAEASPPPAAWMNRDTRSQEQNTQRYAFGFRSENCDPRLTMSLARIKYIAAAKNIGAMTSVEICVKNAVLLYGHFEFHVLPAHPMVSTKDPMKRQ